jgi:hypothetical protein
VQEGLDTVSEYRRNANTMGGKRYAASLFGSGYHYSGWLLENGRYFVASGDGSGNERKADDE